MIPAWLLPPQNFKVCRTHKAKRVKIGDRIFPSALVAAATLACSESRIRVMIYRGKAEYLD